MTEPTLSGRRVLVVEDDETISALMETTLEEALCTVVGPCRNVASALAAVGNEAFDVAVLDINLAGEMVFPVAEALDARGVPFMLLSGYGDTAVPDDRPSWPVCAKPFKLDELLQRLGSLVEQRGSPRG
jgi:DNA-binding response OmpR family regulator